MNPYKQHFLRLAVYNRWAYRQLYDKLDEFISDENYRADSGLFFRSIHGTLVHLLLSNRLWHSRLVKSSAQPLDNGKYPHEINSYWARSPEEWEAAVSDRKDLQEQVMNECNRWINYVKELNENSLMNEETIEFVDTKKNPHVRSLTELLDHIFNHNTHHRGQVTAAITKYGGQKASPVLDLFAMPKDEYNL